MAKSKQLVVKAPLVIIRNADGSRQHLYAGTPVPDEVDTEHRDQLLEEGMLAKVDVADPAPAEEPADTGDKVPAKSASKADWVAYATDDARGDDRLTKEEADALTKEQLAEKYQV